MSEERTPEGEGPASTPDAVELRKLAQVFSDVSIAPLGRNYFDRYREIRDALQEAADAVSAADSVSGDEGAMEGDGITEGDAGGEDQGATEDDGAGEDGDGPGEGDAGGGVDPEALCQHLDADDLEFMDAIVRNLRNFAQDGIGRVGQVEPYVSAGADADRLEPLLDAFRPLLEE